MRLDSGGRVLVEYRLDLTVRGASELTARWKGAAAARTRRAAALRAPGRDVGRHGGARGTINYGRDLDRVRLRSTPKRSLRKDGRFRADVNERR